MLSLFSVGLLGPSRETLDERIAEPSGLIVRGGVPEPVEGQPLHGAEVTLRFDDGEVVTLRVIAITAQVAEDDDAAAVTLDSPLGRALAGSKVVGDVVEYATSSGSPTGRGLGAPNAREVARR